LTPESFSFVKKVSADFFGKANRKKLHPAKSLTIALSGLRDFIGNSFALLAVNIRNNSSREWNMSCSGNSACCNRPSLPRHESANSRQHDMHNIDSEGRQMPRHQNRSVTSKRLLFSAHERNPKTFV